MTDEELDKLESEMARGALDSINETLTNLGIPRGTWADDQVNNLIAMYNLRGDTLDLTSNLLDLAKQEIQHQQNIISTLDHVLVEIAKWPNTNNEQIAAIKLLAASVVSPNKAKSLKTLTE